MQGLYKEGLYLTGAVQREKDHILICCIPLWSHNCIPNIALLRAMKFMPIASARCTWCPCREVTAGGPHIQHCKWGHSSLPLKAVIPASTPEAM